MTVLEGGPGDAIAILRLDVISVCRFENLAGATGLEPAAACVTGRRYNQLNYASGINRFLFLPSVPFRALGFPKLPETAVVTAKRKVVTYRKQTSRMASFGAVRNDREPLSKPYQTHDLCPLDLCPDKLLKTSDLP